MTAVIHIRLLSLWSNKWRFQDNIFFQEQPFIFQRDKTKPHSAHNTKAQPWKDKLSAWSPDNTDWLRNFEKTKSNNFSSLLLQTIRPCLQNNWNKIKPEILYHFVFLTWKYVLLLWNWIINKELVKAWLPPPKLGMNVIVIKNVFHLADVYSKWLTSQYTHRQEQWEGFRILGADQTSYHSSGGL